MTNTTFALLFDEEGVPGLIKTDELTDKQSGEVEVLLQSRSSILVPREQIQAKDAGVYFVPLRFAALEPEDAARPDDALVIPVLVEKARIDKRWVETGRVRVTKAVHEERQDIEALLRREDVQIERVPVNRPLDRPVETRYEGEVLVIPVVEEELIVEKRLILREEVRITKRETEKPFTDTATLRKESVDVQRLQASEDQS